MNYSDYIWIGGTILVTLISLGFNIVLTSRIRIAKAGKAYYKKKYQDNKQLDTSSANENKKLVDEIQNLYKALNVMRNLFFCLPVSIDEKGRVKETFEVRKGGKTVARAKEGDPLRRVSVEGKLYYRLLDYDDFISAEILKQIRTFKIENFLKAIDQNTVHIPRKQV